jgi:hypothetical protein
MKCCQCKREATRQRVGYEWMCAWHFNRLIRHLRIQRKLDRKS